MGSPSAPGTPVEVRAAGGVPWRRHEGVVQVLLVHRPRYDDWTFPKGKADGADESDEDCARREVLEETGLHVELGGELEAIEYYDAKSRWKRVRYWALDVRGGAFVPNDEVDESDWVDVGQAEQRLTYPRDRRVLASFLALGSG